MLLVSAAEAIVKKVSIGQSLFSPTWLVPSVLLTLGASVGCAYKSLIGCTALRFNLELKLISAEGS